MTVTASDMIPELYDGAKMDVNAASAGEQSTPPAMKPVSLGRAMPVKVACLGCRSRKLKCNALHPICTRCSRESRACHYADSRRGKTFSHLHRGNSQSVCKQKPKTSGTLLLESGSLQDTPSPQTASVTFDADAAGAYSQFDFDTMLLPSPIQGNLLWLDSEMPTVSVESFHLSYFYERFWPCHPFLPPRPLLEQQLNTGEAACLAPVVAYVGSIYAAVEHEASAALPLPKCPRDYPSVGSSVQMLILLTIATHMANYPEESHELFNKAVDLALDIKMHRSEYAASQGQCNAAIEESWRRTWWELYCLDVMFVALHQTGCARMHNQGLDIPLPCEEDEYKNHMPMPTSKLLADFNSRFFADDDEHYSSFTYRIAATQCLGRIVRVTNGLIIRDRSLLQEAELSLSNLLLYLPKSKRTIISRGGQIDEVLFQAHMVMRTATIYLHRPQSELNVLGGSHGVTCASDTEIISVDLMQHHTNKTINAADEICSMIDSSSLLNKCTPFFTCALVLQALVHLAAYHIPQIAYKKPVMQQQIQMSVGALKNLASIWPLGQTVLKQVKQVARMVLESPRETFGSGQVELASSRQATEQGAMASTTFSDVILTQEDESWSVMFQK